jgi:hypothetical protein
LPTDNGCAAPARPREGEKNAAIPSEWREGINALFSSLFDPMTIREPLANTLIRTAQSLKAHKTYHY